MIDRSNLSRRRFLGASAAVGAGWLCGRAVAADVTGGPIAVDLDRFVLLADTHIMEKPDQANRNVKPAETFTQARGEIRPSSPARRESSSPATWPTAVPWPTTSCWPT